MMRKLIGKTSEWATYEVEKGAIRLFAMAIGEENPLSLEEAAAQKAGFKSLVAPLTFPSFFFGATTRLSTRYS